MIISYNNKIIIIRYNHITYCIANGKELIPNGVACHKNPPFPFLGIELPFNISLFCRFNHLIDLCPKHSHPMEEHLFFLQLGMSLLTHISHGLHLNVTHQLFTETAEGAPAYLNSRPWQLRWFHPVTPSPSVHPFPTAHSPGGFHWHLTSVMLLLPHP